MFTLILQLLRLLDHGNFYNSSKCTLQREDKKCA